MPSKASLIGLAVLLASGAVHADPLWEGRTAAFFGVTFVDTSHEGALRGTREDEIERTAMLTAYVAEALEAEGLVLVDLGLAEEELARTVNPAKCNGCDLRMARRLGAEYSITSEVFKVSNLIMSVNLYIRDAETGAQLRGLSADIRSNTDESWLRGMRYILTNAIFPES
jgi:hypothetical protein